MVTLPEAIGLKPAHSPDSAVIWLHGLGADGHDFEPIVPELRLPAQLRVRFVFPHAPVRPVTLNMGMPMRAWYDILQLGGGREDDAGIRASQELVEGLLARELARGKQPPIEGNLSLGGPVSRVRDRCAAREARP